jgi:hypothetical protein
MAKIQTTTKPTVQAKTKTEATASKNSIAQTPSTKKSSIIVLDSFQSKTSDIDGDGVGDVSHGEFVSRLLKAKTNNGFNITQLELGNNPTAAFKNVTAQLKKGAAVAGINLSNSLNVPWVTPQGKKMTDQSGNDITVNPSPENLATAVYPGDSAKQQAFIERGNSTGYSAQDKKDMKAYFEKTYYTVIPAYKEMLGEAARRGIPVTVSAGNEPNRLNPYTLFEPSVSVGSLGRGGAPSSYSSKLSSPDGAALGEVNHGRTAGGIDVTGDGQADFTNAELSGGTNKLSQVLGKQYSSVAATESDYQAVARHFSDQANISPQPTNTPQVTGKVFELSRLTSLMKSEAQKTGRGNFLDGNTVGQKIHDLYATSSGYVTFTPDKGLGLSSSPVNIQNGRVVIDVTGSGGNNVVQSSYGTSWAAPIKLAELVMAKQKATRVSGF